MQRCQCLPVVETKCLALNSLSSMHVSLWEMTAEKCSSLRLLKQVRYNFPLQMFTSTGHFLANLRLLSPVWVLCIHSKCFNLKVFFTGVTVKEFTSVWILMWSLKIYLRVKRLPQSVQEKGLSPVWVLVWQFIWLMTKAFATNCTNERLITCVNSGMLI